MTKMFKKVKHKHDFTEREKELTKWWQTSGVLEKYLNKNKDSDKNFSFIDGPITANNPMGLHHAWGRTYKDIWQRYKNMQGFEQRFQNGFDCQGLWVEVEVEKDLGFNSKKDIEDYGVGEFTNACKARVNEYADKITEQSKRLGMFMDWDNSYFTMSETNNLYIWKFLKICKEKGLIYKDKSSTTWCPRCETGLSQHEQADGYKMIKDTSVYVKFKLKGKENEYFLVWTTTPWTLSANVLLAVNPEFEYVKAEKDGEYLYLAKDSAERLGLTEYEEVDPKQLLDTEFEAIYDSIPVQEGVDHYVVEWDLVDPSEGTGVVHIAPGCGQEDFELGTEVGANTEISPLDETGTFVEGYGDLSGKYAHDVADQVIEYLKEKEVLYKVEQVEHSYPHCWRCKTKCLFRLEDNWFINIQEVKPDLKKRAKDANWMPEFAGKRMQDWLDNMGDWMISRNRFYGLSLPFYECAKCDKMTVIGSKEELKELAVEPGKVDELPSLHRPWIDDVKIKCPHCNEVVERIELVGDCWLDAGVVPFSTLKYFDDKEYWNKWFPADFISEMIEQVRLWFYSMLVYGVLFEDKVPYQNVLTHGEVRDENNERFSKSGVNYIPFDEAANKIGSDVIRWLYSTQSVGGNVRFGWNIADEARRKFVIPFWNSYKYFVTYANLHDFDQEEVELENLNVMDKWILAKLNNLNQSAERNLDEYDVATFARATEAFIQDVSTWYIRRSRNRFMNGNKSALSTMYVVLDTLSKLIAPVVPYITEDIFQNLRKDDDPMSIHLCDYPEVDSNYLDNELMRNMETVRAVSALGQTARVETGNKVRQPLSELYVKGVKLDDELLQIVVEELNVKDVKVVDELPESSEWDLQKEGGIEIALNTELTDQLKKEGLFREVSRKIQHARKKAGLNIGDEVKIAVCTNNSDIKEVVNTMNDELKDAVSATEVTALEKSEYEDSTKQRVFVKME